MIESIILLLIGGFLSMLGFFGKSIIDSKTERRRIEEQRRIEDKRIEEQRKFEQTEKRKEFLSSQITNSLLSKDLRILAYTEYKALGGNGFADQYVRENLQ